MSSEFRHLWSRRYEVQLLAKDLKNKKYNILIIYHYPGLIKDRYIEDMLASRQDGSIVVGFVDGLSWGWASKYIDYRFVLPKNLDKVKYSRLARMLLKREINAIL